MALAPVPNAAFGYLLWQTAVALYSVPEPVSGGAQEAQEAQEAKRARLHAYAEKAMREAADGTGWIDPDEEFESAVHAAVDAAHDNSDVHELIASLAARIEPHGWVNSLSQKVIQLTMPGVPDVYQGSELWEDSLADPDNRRPVDFGSRHATLTTLTARTALTEPPALDGTGVAQAVGGQPRTASPPGTPRAVHWVHPGAGRRAGADRERLRAATSGRLRPWGRDHPGDQTSGRPVCCRWLGRHHPAAATRPIPRRVPPVPPTPMSCTWPMPSASTR